MNKLKMLTAQEATDVSGNFHATAAHVQVSRLNSLISGNAQSGFTLIQTTERLLPAVVQVLMDNGYQMTQEGQVTIISWKQTTKTDAPRPLKQEWS